MCPNIRNPFMDPGLLQHTQKFPPKTKNKEHTFARLITSYPVLEKHEESWNILHFSKWSKSEVLLDSPELALRLKAVAVNRGSWATQASLVPWRLVHRRWLISREIHDHICQIGIIYDSYEILMIIWHWCFWSLLMLLDDYQWLLMILDAIDLRCI